MDRDRRLKRIRASLFSKVACLAAILSACQGCGTKEAAVAELPPPRVTVADVVTQEVTDYDEYTGQTEASEIVEIRARVYGYLKTIDFKEPPF